MGKNRRHRRRRSHQQKLLEQSRAVSLIDQLSSPETSTADSPFFPKGAWHSGSKPQHHLLEQPPQPNNEHSPRGDSDGENVSSVSEFVRDGRDEKQRVHSEVRSWPKVEFVYPRHNGVVRPFAFSTAETLPNDNVEAQSTSTSVEDKKRNESHTTTSTETMEDILSKNKRKNPSVCPENGNAKAKVTIHEPDMSPGKLSGVSVDDAVKDRYGCRPRANSTDGELNLPRRGLCDEHMVLESHKWKLDPNLLASSPKGFNNLGNTCFLNSTLQCLAYLPPFCQSLLAMPDQQYQNGATRKISQGKRITFLLRSLFQRVHRRDIHGNNTLSPQAIVKAIPSLGTIGSRNGYKFRPGRQEDAHEFLVHLLDAMHDGELREAGINQHSSGWRDRLPVPRLDETTFVHRIFGGYLRSQVMCTKCGYCSNTYDPFFDLALEISKKSCNNVVAAFTDFTRKETLDSENRWKCSGCKKRVCATKQLTVFRPPLSLCVQMKRFTFGRGFGGLFKNGFGMGRSGSKISKPIEFPAEMQLPLSDKRSCPYALTGIVIHVGVSSDSGHYTAYVKAPGKAGNGQWYHLDDSFVARVPESVVLQQKDAYLLFYSRKEVKLEFPSPPPRGSMSAEQATELARVRAKARANSLTEGESENPKKASTKDPHEEFPVRNPHENPKQPTSIASNEQKPDGSSDSSSSSSESESQVDSKNKVAAAAATGDKIPSSLKRKSPESRTAEGVGQASSSRDGSSSSSDPDSSDSESSTSSESNTGTTPPEVAKTTAIAAKPPGNADAFSDPGSEKKSDPTREQVAKAKNPLEAHAARSEIADGGNEANKSILSEKKRKSDLTRVVTGRGSGREKVSVMLGPRHHKPKKAWTPQSSGTTKLGQDFELLGNRSVDKWDDDADTTPDTSVVNVAQGRKQMVRKMENESRSRKRKMHLDRWDATLDRGKAKKVKQKADPSNPVGISSNVHPSKNVFQRILTSVQKMNRGRPKGHFRADQSNKQNKKQKR